MTQYDEYDEYDEYATGDDWDYNDEMQALFEDRFATARISERPTAAEAPDNAKFLAEDESIIYRNDPSNGWVVAGFGTDTDRIPEGYFDSVDVEELGIDKKLNQRGFDTALRDVVQVDRKGTGAIDRGDTHPGRVMDRYWYNDPPYDSATAMDNRPITPSDVNPKLIANGYVWSVATDPVEVYRNTYTFPMPDTSTKILTCQAGSTLQSSGGWNTGPLDANRESGAIVLGTETPDNGEAALYRWTGNGSDVSEVYRMNKGTGDDEVHGLVHDRHDPGTWYAATGDSATNKYLMSTDDGETFERVNHGFHDGHQALTVDVGPDYIYYAGDEIEPKNTGPWCVDKETGDVQAVFSEDTYAALSEWMGWKGYPIDNSVYHDDDSGYIFFQTRANGHSLPYDWVIYYARGVGDTVNFLTDGRDPKNGSSPLTGVMLGSQAGGCLLTNNRAWPIPRRETE